LQVTEVAGRVGSSLQCNAKRRECRINKVLLWLVSLGAGIAVALTLYMYVAQRNRPSEPPQAAEVPRETPAPPAVRHPIEAVQPGGATDVAATPLPPLAESDAAVESALQGLIGQQALVEFLNIGPHIRHLVATVDSLPRKKVAVRMWPVKRTPGQFIVAEPGAEATRIAELNSARYVRFVDLVTSVDTEQVVALYVYFYPLLQQAYEDLGYPGRHFNDRVVEVIDHLLAAPEPGLVEVVQPPQDPAIDVDRPWVMYRFADPRLESLSAGQKILVRVGPENAARLKGKLTELRRKLASGPPPVASSPG